MFRPWGKACLPSGRPPVSKIRHPDILHPTSRPAGIRPSPLSPPAGRGCFPFLDVLRPPGRVARTVRMISMFSTPAFSRRSDFRNHLPNVGVPPPPWRVPPPLEGPPTLGEYPNPWRVPPPLESTPTLGEYPHPWRVPPPLEGVPTLGGCTHPWRVYPPLESTLTLGEYPNPWRVPTPLEGVRKPCRRGGQCCERLVDFVEPAFLRGRCSIFTGNTHS
jgi:hypothetical protein